MAEFDVFSTSFNSIAQVYKVMSVFLIKPYEYCLTLIYSSKDINQYIEMYLQQLKNFASLKGNEEILVESCLLIIQCFEVFFLLN